MSDSDESTEQATIYPELLERDVGIDLQGIPWHLLDFERSQLRQSRHLTYRNYRESAPLAGTLAFSPVFPSLQPRAVFESTYRSARSSIYHFQLRHLLSSPTSRNIYYSGQSGELLHLCPISSKVTTLAHVSYGITSLVSWYRERGTFVAIGGMAGQLQVFDGASGHIAATVLMASDTGTELSRITNALALTRDGQVLISCHNDNKVRFTSLASFQLSSEISLPWPVNFARCNSPGTTALVVGDAPEALLVDLRSSDAGVCVLFDWSFLEEVVMTLRGHVDHGFSCAFHPNDLMVATANQDQSVKVWDLRNTQESIATLPARMSAFRSVCFSSDGDLIAAEAADFVHIYSRDSQYEAEQVIDFFGEIAGVCLTPDEANLYISVSDNIYGCLINFSFQSPESDGILDLL